MIKEAPKDFPAVSLFSDAPHTHTDCPTIVAWRPIFKKSVALKWIVEHFSNFLMLLTFLLMIKFRLKLKIVRKTTRTFRYDINQIPYDYTVEVTNRFKGLDLIECLKNYGWRFMTLYRRQGSRPSPRKRNAKRNNDCPGRPYKQLWKEEKRETKEERKDIPIWMQSSKE